MGLCRGRVRQYPQPTRTRWLSYCKTASQSRLGWEFARRIHHSQAKRPDSSASYLLDILGPSSMVAGGFNDGQP
jgi:hypothetical protein